MRMIIKRQRGNDAYQISSKKADFVSAFFVHVICCIYNRPCLRAECGDGCQCKPDGSFYLAGDLREGCRYEKKPGEHHQDHDTDPDL